MAYRLEPVETLPDGVRRMAREQLDGAIDGLRAGAKGSATEVHDARKRIKKTRSLLRLVRDEIGDELYRHENDRLRTIARSLAGARDAQVLIEALDAHTQRANGRLSEEASARLRLRFESDRDAAVAAGAGGGLSMRKAATQLEAVRDGIAAWPLERDDFGTVARGLRRNYKRGRADMHAAVEEPTVVNLHEWRKRAKDLWYHHRILEPVWPGPMKAVVDAADELGEVLGEDHDLAILHRRTGDHADAVGGAADLAALLESIARRRLELRLRAFALGRRLYAERPKAMVERLASAWEAWREESEPGAGAGENDVREIERMPGPDALEAVELADPEGRRAVDGLHGVDLHIAPHEASDLLPIASDSMLGAHGWDLGFWAVLDDVRAERSLVAIGHRSEAVAVAEGWEAIRVRGRAHGDTRRTEDAEALACHAGHVYVFGSHFGGKRGPLEPQRAFVARFEEEAVPLPLGSGKVELEVARNAFALHRAVNDALREARVPLHEIDADVCERFVEGARRRGAKKDKAWAERLQEGDVPINVEGAAFRANGALLLGLRLPTTADGDPLLVELASVDPLFSGGEEEIEVSGFWILQGLGSPQAPAGVRALRDRGFEVHAITGSLEGVGKDSAVLEEHPEGERSRSTHSLFRLPNRRGRLRRVRPTVVRHFPHLRDVEGLSPDTHGRFYYVADSDDKVPLRFSESSLEELVRDREGPVTTGA